MSGSFSIKNAYKKLREGDWNSNEVVWKIPWKFQRPQRDEYDPSLQNSWIRLNMDGVVRAEDAFATAGGFLQDRNGGGLFASVDIWAIVQF
ncbi:hypothetical protein Gotur_019089 [Gossypium turneri]